MLHELELWCWSRLWISSACRLHVQHSSTCAHHCWPQHCILGSISLSHFVTEQTSQCSFTSSDTCDVTGHALCRDHTECTVYGRLKPSVPVLCTLLCLNFPDSVVNDLFFSLFYFCFLGTSGVSISHHFYGGSIFKSNCLWTSLSPQRLPPKWLEFTRFYNCGRRVSA